jgi:hypothetical protein
LYWTSGGSTTGSFEGGTNSEENSLYLQNVEVEGKNTLLGEVSEETLLGEYMLLTRNGGPGVPGKSLGGK